MTGPMVPIPASNQYGHGVPVAARVMPEMIEAIGKLVASPQFPTLEKPSDVVRQAIVDLLERCENEEPGLLTELDYIKLLITIEARESKLRGLEDVVVRLVHILDDHLQRGRLQDASRIAEEVASVVAQMPAGEMREQSEGVTAKYRFLLPKKNGKPMSLKPSKAEAEE